MIIKVFQAYKGISLSDQTQNQQRGLGRLNHRVIDIGIDKYVDDDHVMNDKWNG